MSIKVMSWVWENGPADGVERLVLLALADFSDEHGRCWPSMETIGAKSCMTARGARNVVRRLEAGGWISTVRGGGRGGCSVYQISTQKPERDTGNEIPGKPNPEPDAPKPGTTRHKTRNAGSAEPSRTTKEPSKKSARADEMPFEAPDRAAEQDRFREFWAVYPRKDGQLTAEGEWFAAVLTSDPDEIISGARRYAQSVKGQEVRFMAMPAKWLKAKRWTDQGAAVPQSRFSAMAAGFGV